MSTLATIGSIAPVGLTEDLRKLAAWYKASSVAGAAYRIDCDGRSIVWEEYGKYTDSGWQIDYILATAAGGTDQLFNLRARHWRGTSQAGGLLGALLKYT